MGTNPTGAPPSAAADARQLLLKRYDDYIQYYRKASKANKRSYKTTRYLTVVLGAAVTLIASLSSADFLGKVAWVSISLKVMTPLLSAILAIVGGVSQAFQWGAAWSDMVITSTRLEGERDRVTVTPDSNLDPLKEMMLLDSIVLGETRGFFQRLFGTGGPAPTNPTDKDGAGGGK